jgi:hypothetical protein
MTVSSTSAAPSKALGRWLYAPTDRETLLAVDGLNRRVGVLVVDVVIDSHVPDAMVHVADAVLSSMGKDMRLSTTVAAALPLAAAWIAGARISDVVILSGQDLSPAVLADIAEWFGALGARSWFILPDPADGVDDPRIARCVATLEAFCMAAALGDLWHELRDTRVELLWQEDPLDDPPSQPLWMVPRVDGLFFRDACRRLLQPEVFVEVDKLFVGLVREFLAAISDEPGIDATAEIEALVASRLEVASGDEELLVVVRAAQVAAVRRRYRIRVDTTLLLGAAATLPRPGLAGPQRWFERMMAYRQPDPGAVAALYWKGMDLRAISLLSVGDVAVAGSVVRVQTGTEELVFDGPAAVFLRAQWFRRVLGGAASSDRFIVTHRGPWASDEYLADQLRYPSDELGCRLIDPVPARSAHTSGRLTLTRYGIEVTKVFRNLPLPVVRPEDIA